MVIRGPHKRFQQECKKLDVLLLEEGVSTCDEAFLVNQSIAMHLQAVRLKLEPRALGTDEKSRCPVILRRREAGILRRQVVQFLQQESEAGDSHHPLVLRFQNMRFCRIRFAFDDQEWHSHGQRLLGALGREPAIHLV